MAGTLTWWGHSTCEIRTEQGLHVLIDPWFKGNPSYPREQAPEKADLILLTHDHRDHTGDPGHLVELLKATGAKLVAQPEIITRLTGLGVPSEACVGMNVGGTFRMKDFSAKMVHAFHSSISGTPAGYIMTVGDTRIYHLGDTGLFGDLKLFGELWPMDIVLVPIGGHFTMDAADAAIAVSWLRPRKAVPIHYATFPALAQDAGEFQAEVRRQAPGVEVLVPKAGDIIELSAGLNVRQERAGA